MSRSIVLALVACASCGHRDGERSLSERVELYCFDLRNDLDRATSQYKELAGWITEKHISEDQQRRAEVLLDFRISDEARGNVSLELHKRFAFCAGVRNIDGKRFDDITTQVSILTQKFAETRDRTEMAQTLEKLSKLSQDVVALPIRE